MLVRHLVVGVVAGALTALVSGLMGLSVWAMAGIYVLGANLGLGVSALVALVPGRQVDASASAGLGRPALVPARTLPPAE